MRLPPNKDLSAEFIDATPIDYDWTTGYAEAWECMEAAECSECGQEIVFSIGEEQHRYIDDDSHCLGSVCCEGPQMNYYYPVGRGKYTTDNAKVLAGLPVCLVWFLESDFRDGTAGLALTGGGQDLSWEICEAYILLGYLPPIHFTDLPDMAGIKMTRRVRRILSACQESLRVKRRRVKSRYVKLRELRERIKKRAKGYRGMW